MAAKLQFLNESKLNSLKYFSKVPLFMQGKHKIAVIHRCKW